MKRPNVVFIISDDQGEWSLGSGGSSEVITPNLDRLAAEGMRFNRFYCASPVCSPARASLLTGRIPSQHGIHDWLRDDTKAREEIEYLKDQSGYTDILSRNGYICGLSGKWHMGNSAVPQKGFSHWFCHKSGGGPYYNAPMYRNGRLYHEPRYITDVIADDAIEFLDTHAGGEAPFYLHVSFTAPHSPWLGNHPREYLEMYKDCEFHSLPRLPRHPDSIYLTDEVAADLRGNQIGYFAAVTAMDYNIGRILDKLDALSAREDTVVIFTSDNGFSCGHHGFWGKGNATFPINLYETSVKVPFLIRWPGRIAAGKTQDRLCSAYDFRPTLLDCLGILDDPEETLPGTSFASLLTGQECEGRGSVVVFDEYGPNRMIRDDRYKYIRRYPYGPDQLFDLEADPGEEHNLIESSEYSQVLSRLTGEMEQWFARYVNPEIDGAREAVNGSGQKNLAGLRAGGESSYCCDDYIKENPNFKQYLP